VKIWRKIMRGCKFLVVRRDGTVPVWEWFVLGSRDPAASAALRAYAAEGRRLGFDEEYCASIDELASDFEREREARGSGNPDAGPHRTDKEGIIDLMAGDVGTERIITVRREAA
jgi:hypothetical protein